MGQRTRDLARVLEAVRELHRQGMTLVPARQRAVVSVAKDRAVRPETIRAACVRSLRPDVETLSDLDRLIERWLVTGDDLLEQLMHRITRGDSDEAAINSLFVAC